MSAKLNTELTNCLANVASLIANGYMQPPELSRTPNQKLLLAFSGGPDSTALLIALHKVAPAFGIQIIACHINHGLRATESDKDAQFCQSLCQKLNIELGSIKLSAKDFENSHGPSEEQLRELRYKYLTNFAQSKNINYLLTAHTLDDQIETLFFRLFRGTSLSGLKGISFSRKLQNRLYLLRPLLKISKAECARFLEEQGQKFCQDASNFDDIYTRNYIRHKILPTITNRFPDLNYHLDSLRDTICAEDEFIAKIAYELYEKFTAIDPNNWSLKSIKELPLALQRRVLAYALQSRSIEVSFKRLEQIIALINLDHKNPSIPTKAFSFNLNAFWRVKCITEMLAWQHINPIKTKTVDFESIPVSIPSTNFLPVLNSLLRIEPYQENTDNYADNHLNSRSTEVLVDLTKIAPPLIIRKRKAGDRIHPLGMSQSVRLKQYLHTHKKPDDINSLARQIVLADQVEVLWLPGIGLSDKIKVTNKPSHKLEWHWVGNIKMETANN